VSYYQASSASLLIIHLPPQAVWWLVACSLPICSPPAFVHNIESLCFSPAYLHPLCRVRRPAETCISRDRLVHSGSRILRYTRLFPRWRRSPSLTRNLILLPRGFVAEVALTDRWWMSRSNPCALTLATTARARSATTLAGSSTLFVF
jgi:hypothetical protein